MKTLYRHTARLLLFTFVWQTILVTPLRADIELSAFRHILSGLKRPKSHCEPNAEDLANKIDRLEFEIETYGSVVPKQPDVWGEARMTKHRQDVERILEDRLDDFEVTLNAAVRRSDQSFFATAAALNAAVLADSEGSGTKTAVQTSIDLLPDPNAEKQDIIDRTGNEPINLKNFSGEKPAIGLEPTIVLDQLNRYLGHLNELRRINEGDDTSDSPGYSMNLVRIPVSVLPGKKTREGYGAEVTFTATPHLTEELLPTTFRNLLVNDVVDQLALPLAQFYNNDREKADASIRWIKKAKDAASEGIKSFEAWAEKMQYQAANDAGLTPEEKTAINLTLLQFAEKKQYYWERLFELSFLSNQIKNASGTSASLREGVRKTIYLNNQTPASIYLKYVDLQETAAKLIRTGQADVPIEITLPKQTKTLKIKLPITWIQNPGDFLQWIIQVEQNDTISFPIEISKSKKRAIIQANEIIKSLLDPNSSILSSLVDSFAGHYKGLISISLDEYFQDSSASLGGGNTSLRSRRARLPLPSSQMPVVYGGSLFGQVAASIYATAIRNPVALSNAPISKSHIHLIDIRRALADELDAAHRFLSRQDSYPLWDFANPELTQAIRQRDLYTINQMRTDFLTALPRHPKRDELKHSVTAALAWGIIVEAAFLNEQLIDDMQRVAREKACECMAQGPLRFYLPKPPVVSEEHSAISPESYGQWQAEFSAASQAFIEYVRCRWPIHVFALDPAVQEQNVADIFNVRREMQMSLAVGVALGEISAGQAQKHARRMELDMETIDLNRTIVGFSHGTDTFGWRFYPRVQAGDPTCYPCTIANTFSGRTLQRDYLIKQRRLEPGMRECVAVVLMPSFVPHVLFESRGSWFQLTNPRHKELTLKESLQISRDYQCVKKALHCVCDRNCYRPGDVAQLSGVVQQMERRLPLQSTLVQVPHENRLGGFEMFDTGLTDLSPELLGWYGAPGVKVGGEDKDCRNGGVKYRNENQCKFTCKGTTLFLVGSKFSVHETKVIAGGKCVPFTLLSRDIMRVTIDSNANPLTHDGKQYVDVHVATPYGVTNHLLIPAFSPKKKDEDAPKQEEIAELKQSIASLQNHVVQSVAALKNHVVQVEFDAAQHKLVYDVSCADGNPLNLQFELRDKNNRIPFTYQSLSSSMQDQPAKLTMALYNGSYLNSLLPVPLGNSPTGEFILKREGAPDMQASELDKLIKNLLKTNVSHSNFDKDKKYKLNCQFFLEVPPGAEVPIRVMGGLPVELNLICECCRKESADEAAPTVTPAADSPATESKVKDPQSTDKEKAKTEAESIPAGEPTQTDENMPGPSFNTGSAVEPCDCSSLRIVGSSVGQ